MKKKSKCKKFLKTQLDKSQTEDQEAKKCYHLEDALVPL